MKENTEILSIRISKSLAQRLKSTADLLPSTSSAGLARTALGLGLDAIVSKFKLSGSGSRKPGTSKKNVNKMACLAAIAKATKEFQATHADLFSSPTVGYVGLGKVMKLKNAPRNLLGVTSYTVGIDGQKDARAWFPRIVASRRGCRFIEITTTIEELPAVLAWVAAWAGMVDAPLVAPPVPFCEMPGPGPRWAQVLGSDCEKQYFWTVAANDSSVELTGKGLSPRDRAGACETP